MFRSLFLLFLLFLTSITASAVDFSHEIVPLLKKQCWILIDVLVVVFLMLCLK
jgi:hypothetical protein